MMRYTCKRDFIPEEAAAFFIVDTSYFRAPLVMAEGCFLLAVTGRTCYLLWGAIGGTTFPPVDGTVQSMVGATESRRSGKKVKKEGFSP